MTDGALVRLRVADTRSSGMRSGIRVPVWVDHALNWEGVPVVHDVQLTFDGEVLPGRETIAQLAPLHPELWPDLRAGSRHDLLEGTIRGSWIEIVEPFVRG